jgi:hypothetical protein
MIKRLIACVISIFILTVNIDIAPVFAADTTTVYTDGDYTYSINEDGTAKLVSYIGTATNVVIPSTIHGLTVTVLGYELFFQNQTITSVFIPATAINLEYVNTVNCSFEQTPNLKSITVDTANPVLSSNDGVLFRYNGIGEFSLAIYPQGKLDSSYRVPDGTEELGEMAFYNNPYLKTIIIPSTVYDVAAAFNKMQSDIVFLRSGSFDVFAGMSFYAMKAGTRIIVKNSTVENIVKSGINTGLGACLNNIEIVNLETASADVKASYEVPATNLTFTDHAKQWSKVLSLGSTYSLRGDIIHTPADTSEAVSWVSSNPAVATVDTFSGTVKALTTGNTAITGTDESGHSISLNLQVYNPVTSFAGVEDSGTLDCTNYTSSARYSSWVNIEPYEVYDVKWKSDDETVLKLDTVNNTNGLSEANFIPGGVGQTTITATYTDLLSGQTYTYAHKTTVVKSVAKCTVSTIPAQTYNGTGSNPKVTITDGTKPLTDGIDYTLEYKNYPDDGYGYVTVYGKGFYTGSVYSNDYTITKLPASSSTDNSNVVAVEQPLKVSSKNLSNNIITVAYGSTVTVKGTAKTAISYGTGNGKIASVTAKGKITPKKTGTTTLIVTAKGTSTYKQATTTLTIVVVPQKETVSSLKSLKKAQLTVNWVKDNKATGYQIQYSTDKNFKNVKTVVIKKNSTISQTIKKLTKGKKYYVRVSAFKTVKVDGNSVDKYGSFSSTQVVKVRK